MKNLYDYIVLREYLDILNQPIEDFLHENEQSTADWKDHVFESILDSSQYNDYLYESLLHSYSLEKFLKKLKENFTIYLSQLDNNNRVLYIRVGQDFDINNKEFVSLCNLFNVFIAKDESRTETIRDITFEQRIPEDITEEVFKYNYVYHLTSHKVVDKILKYGLQPKSHSKKAYHPKRVYLLLPLEGLNVRSMMSQLGADRILKIDLKKLKKYNQQIKFFRDPMSRGSYSIFTENIIYPEVISEV